MAKPKKWMNRKAKGTNAERELIHIFHKFAWSAVRIAGSGSTRNPAPDVLACNGFRRIAIEAKLIAATRKYFSYQDVEQLQAFSKTFGCESWLAVKFPNKEWAFFNPEDLIETKTAFVATVDLADRCGLSIEELLEVVSLGQDTVNQETIEESNPLDQFDGLESDENFIISSE